MKIYVLMFISCGIGYLIGCLTTYIIIKREFNKKDGYREVQNFRKDIGL